MTNESVPRLHALGVRHGLELEPDTITVNEAGLDFRVGIGRTVNGETWVLRVPRRNDMAEQIAAEAGILELVAPVLPVAVPQWRICTAELVAYPALPGKPGLTIDTNGQLHWHLDVNSKRYAEEFGRLLADLHRLDAQQARAAGVPLEEPTQVRERWRRDIDAVAAAFTIDEGLRRRWEAWLSDDSYWPTWSVFTHGELYPAHVLLDDDDGITGIIDWTTAKVSDPARDFAFQRGMSTPEVFELTVHAYVRAGGRVWPKLAEHALELWTASPVAYGVYALQTGNPEHRAAAQAQLSPPV